VVKTRLSARRLVEQGVVRLNRVKIHKPSQNIRQGDVLTFVWAGRLHVWRVNSIPSRRGRAAEARLLYQELGDGG
jgi:ribosome-associated heat shock protein Hsp15